MGPVGTARDGVGTRKLGDKDRGFEVWSFLGRCVFSCSPLVLIVGGTERVLPLG